MARVNASYNDDLFIGDDGFGHYKSMYANWQTISFAAPVDQQAGDMTSQITPTTTKNSNPMSPNVRENNKVTTTSCCLIL